MMQHINREIPFYPDPIYRPPPRPSENLQSLRIESKADSSPQIDLEFEENLPYQEGIISKHTKGQINHISRTRKISKFSKYRQTSTKFLPKQTDVDKILKLIQ